MLKIKPPDYEFCPFCGRKLSLRKDEETFRKFCFRDSWTYYPHSAGAALAVITRPGKVLLVRRNRAPHKGKWNLPAGFLGYDEHPENALVREVKEETGLTVRKLKLLTILKINEDPREPSELLYVYRTWVASGGSFDNLTDGEENSEIDWKDLDSLPPFAWPSHRQIIEKYIRKKK